MNKLLLISLILGVSACQQHKKPAAIKFKSTQQTFKLKRGEGMQTSFDFTNQGEDSLRIYEVKSDCDCTLANISKKALAPGEKGQIKVSYKSDILDRPGQTVRAIMIKANTKPMLSSLYLVGDLR